MLSLAIYKDIQDRPEIREINKPVFKIGRSRDNDITINDTSVSQVHARINKRGNMYFVSDLKSTNGTSVNDEQIPALKETPLKPGDIITIGLFKLRVSEGKALTNKTADSISDKKLESVGRKDRTIKKRASGDEFEYYRDPQIIKLKQTVHNRLLEMIDLRMLDLSKIGDQELRDQCDEIVHKIIDDMDQKVPEKVNREEFIKDVLDEALGLGPLEDLLADPAVTEIMVNRKDQIYIEHNGKIVLSPKIFSSDLSVLGIISRIVGPVGRRIDESSPMVDARLKDGSRVNAVIPPMALNGPCITIRKFFKEPLVIENLIQFKSLNKAMADFIEICVVNKKNIIISGGTGSGKTTTLNIFSSFIPEGERIVTIEDAAELQLSQDHVVRLESRPPNIEGKGEITIRHLVRNALRMRPDRIIVGECRGGETLDMLQAMNTGHDGSLSTAHANSPQDMLSRLETMVLMAGEDLPSRAIREQIASAVDIIVQQTRLTCGSRVITSIAEVVGIEDDRIILQEIYYFKQEGFDSSGKTVGKFISTGWIPDFFEVLQGRGIEMDMSIFHN